LASKRGVVLTAGIAVAIIGSSFLIWYIPQNNPGTFIDAPRTDNEIVGDVYARHHDLAANIDARFEQWKTDDPLSGDMPAQLVSAKSQIAEMRQQLDNRQPAQEWHESYGIYVQALDAYAAYLDALQQKVDGSDRTNPDPNLAQEWQDLVDKSVSALPIND